MNAKGQGENPHEKQASGTMRIRSGRDGTTSPEGNGLARMPHFEWDFCGGEPDRGVPSWHPIFLTRQFISIAPR